MQNPTNTNHLGQPQHQQWNTDDEIADEADEDEYEEDHSGPGASGGQTQDFDKAYKNLV